MGGQKKPLTTSELAEFVRAHPREVSLEDAQKYGGKQVAWSLKGNEIVAAGDSLEELLEQLRSRGIAPSHTVFDYIDPPDQVWIGWP